MRRRAGLDSATMSAQPASGSASSAKSFVHLHNHTEYSMLDGAARIGDLFSRAAELGMPAVATTDHGYLFGAYEFWKTSTKHGVKPIIGLEAYVTPGTHRTDRTRVKWGNEKTRPGDDVSGSGELTVDLRAALPVGGTTESSTRTAYVDPESGRRSTYEEDSELSFRTVD